MSSDNRRSSAPLAFSPETEAAFQKLLTRYPNKQAALIPALFLCQDDFGYVSVPAMEYVAERLDLAPAKVLSVATFYTMFRRHPAGKRHISVCTGPPCAIIGGDRVVRFFESRLGIKAGQTTTDEQFTLDRAECLASCGTGPMLECNGRYYEDLTDQRLEELFEAWSSSDANESR